MLHRTNAATCVLVALALGAAPAGLQAQDDTYGLGFGVQADAGADVLVGNDFEGWDDALTLGGLMSYSWPTGLELGVAASFVSHDADGTDVTFGTLSAVFRRRFSVPAEEIPHLHPYLDARVGLIEAEADPGGREMGVQLGGGAGLELLLTRALSLVGEVSASYLEIDTLSGLRLLPRVGVKLRF